jgi:hypothetical protein
VVSNELGHAPYSRDYKPASSRYLQLVGGLPVAVLRLLPALPDACSSNSVTRSRDNSECPNPLEPKLLLGTRESVGSDTLLEGSSEGGKVSRVPVSLLQANPLSTQIS